MLLGLFSRCKEGLLSSCGAPLAMEHGLQQLQHTGSVVASKDEALARYSVSREVPRSVLKSEKLLGTLDATPKVPRHTSLT